MKIGILVASWLLVFSVQTTLAQSKSQLEEQKRQKQKNLEEVNKILSETATKRQISVGQLLAIKAQINAKTDLRNNTMKELGMIDEGITENQQIIASMEKDLQNLKKEYAQMIYEASKISNAFNQVTYLFSARSFNEVFRRMQFIKQYSESRRKTVVEIQKMQKRLAKENETVAFKKKDKIQVVSSLEKENEELETLKNQQNTAVKEIMGREQEITVQVQAERKVLLELESQLLTQIREEIKKTGGNNTKTVGLTEETRVISGSFAKNKGALMWPVRSGFISGKFGKQKHPVIANIYTNNPGVKIQTKKGEGIRVVFDGKIDSISEIPGQGYSILVNHGEYFTAYTGLSQVSVQIGDRIKREHVLGVVTTNNEGVSEMIFTLAKNQNFQDPETWLFKK
jgi:murein hydrolase activator